jgi:hypothetical protein
MEETEPSKSTVKSRLDLEESRLFGDAPEMRQIEFDEK